MLGERKNVGDKKSRECTGKGTPGPERTNVRPTAMQQVTDKSLDSFSSRCGYFTGWRYCSAQAEYEIQWHSPFAAISVVLPKFFSTRLETSLHETIPTLVYTSLRIHYKRCTEHFEISLIRLSTKHDYEVEVGKRSENTRIDYFENDVCKCIAKFFAKIYR